MKTTLTRSIGFWILILLSLASAAIGGWLILGQVSTMTTSLLAGTATGVEVYVGQSLVVVGSTLLGAGVLGLLIALALSAVRALLPAAAPAVTQPIARTADGEETGEAMTVAAEVEELSDEPEALDDDQNGSSGSIATATKISVR